MKRLGNLLTDYLDRNPTAKNPELHPCFKDASYLDRSSIQRKASDYLLVYHRKYGGRKFPIDIEHMIEVFEKIPITYKDDGQIGYDILGEYDCAKCEIAVNGCLRRSRVRFTLAHELGHHVLHRSYYVSYLNQNPDSNREDALRFLNSTEYPTSSRLEWQANVFAAECLLPPLLIRRFLDQRSDLGARPALLVPALAHEAQVSQEAVRIRLGLSRFSRTWRLSEFMKENQQ